MIYMYFSFKDRIEVFFMEVINIMQVSKDGGEMFCGCGNKVQVLDIQTGQCKYSIGQVSVYM